MSATGRTRLGSLGGRILTKFAMAFSNMAAWPGVE
jgi:hypothetical protein